MLNSFVVYVCSTEEPDETGMREVSNVVLSQLLNIQFECVNYITSQLYLGTLIGAIYIDFKENVRHVLHNIRHILNNTQTVMYKWHILFEIRRDLAKIHAF